MGMMDSIAAASMSMSEAKLSMAYETALMKKSMDAMETQAMSLIEDLAQAVPAPSQYSFDVYG